MFRIFVFKPTGGFLKEYFKINLFYLFYFALNVALLFLLVDVLKIYPIVSQIFITCFLVIFSYLGNKYFTFRDDFRRKKH
jgi:hypothetical protein